MLLTKRAIDDFFNFGFRDFVNYTPSTEVSDSHFYNAWENNSIKGFPHYNIVKVNERNYSIEIAAAGFSPDDIKIEIENNVLYINGQIKNKENTSYAYRGISSQAFSRTFSLHPGAEIGTIRYENGILSIPVHVPEIENKRKTFQIEATKAVASLE